MRRGRKEDIIRKAKIYEAWQLLTETQSLDNIGLRFGITGERVRQVVEEMSGREKVEAATP